MNRDPRFALSRELEADAIGVKQELEKALTQDGKPYVVLTPERRVSPSIALFGDVLHPQLDKG